MLLLDTCCCCRILQCSSALFFSAVSVLVPKFPGTVEIIPNQSNMACYPADIIVSGVSRGDVVVVQVLLLYDSSVF
jgi:hypothetical protein